MRKEYSKLVRDRIPQIIQQDGRRCGVEAMRDEEYIEALKNKLVEEAQEASATHPEGLITELADLYEVIDSLIIAQGIDREAILVEQERRRTTRGGFKNQIRLLWTE